VSDIVDRANDEAEFFRERAVAGQVARSPRSTSTHCADCGDPIPEARREAVPGAERCIDCQEMAERIKRQERKR